MSTFIDDFFDDDDQDQSSEEEQQDTDSNDSDLDSADCDDDNNNNDDDNQSDTDEGTENGVEDNVHSPLIKKLITFTGGGWDCTCYGGCLCKFYAPKSTNDTDCFYCGHKIGDHTRR